MYIYLHIYSIPTYSLSFLRIFFEFANPHSAIFWPHLELPHGEGYKLISIKVQMHFTMLSSLSVFLSLSPTPTLNPSLSRAA